jgi:type VI secretion system protein ImpC
LPGLLAPKEALMSDAHQSLAGAPATAVTTTLETPYLDKILEGRVSSTKERGTDLIRTLVDRIMEDADTVSDDTEAMINQYIADIDRRVSRQVNEILHHPDFQKLEASWRGLKYLLDQSETGKLLKIKVLNVTKKELLRDMQRATEFDQGALFQKVYEDEFGMFGGEPIGAMIGDYEFGRSAEDLELLKRVSEVASAAHAPFLTSAAPDLLNLESFTNLRAHTDIAKVFDNTEFATWKSFRQSEESRYIGMCVPHILMRLPYGKNLKTVDTFQYEEGVDGTDHKSYLWGNAAYALGARLTTAFSLYGWTAAIRGVEGGGLVQGLPTHNFQTDEGDIALKCPTEVTIPDRREKELADEGFIPLVHCKGTDFAAFFSVQSVQKPKKYDKEAANANARLSTQLPYILAVSRFAHYLKSIMRDKIGNFMSRADCERYLNQWITQYVTPDDTALPEVKAQKPLRDARVEVMDVPGKPGAYKAIAFLRPHFQLDELTISLRLVAELPPSANK